MYSHRKHLTAEDIARLFTAVTLLRDVLLFRLLLETGCRVSEVIAIKIKDIQETSLTVHGRQLPLSSAMRKSLHTFCKDVQKDRYLFTTRQSSQMTTRRIQQLCKYYQDKAQFPFKLTPHVFRYSFIAQSLKNQQPKEVEASVGLKHLVVNDFLTPTEITRLKKAALSPRDQVLVDCLYELGCTVSEVAQLKVKEVKGTTLILGTKVQRSVSIGQPFARSLHSYLASMKLKDEDFLFPSRQSSAMTVRRIQQIIKGLAVQAKIRKLITPHTLRYSCIKRMIDEGITVKEIEERLALKHAEIIVRGFYAHHD